jgi:hypothetical protein
MRTEDYLTVIRVTVSFHRVGDKKIYWLEMYSNLLRTQPMPLKIRRASRPGNALRGEPSLGLWRIREPG